MKIVILVCIAYLQYLLQARQCYLDPAWAESIHVGLSPFKEGITLQMMELVRDVPSTCVVTIQHHQVITDCLRSGLECFLKSIAHHLPNMEFVVNLLDQPRVLKHPCSQTENWRHCACDKDYELPFHGFFLKPDTWRPIYQKVPIFSPGTISSCFSDLLLPSYLHLEHQIQLESIPWGKKQFKAIFRGTSTGGSYSTFSPHYSTFHRQRLVNLCRNISELCDAQFSGYGDCDTEACKQMRVTFGKPSYMRIQEQLKYKMTIDIDGSTYSGRYPLLLRSGSAIIKISVFEDIATLVTRPWEHFIPVKMDLSDFQAKLLWAKDNDREIQQMAARSTKRAGQVLNMPAYKCYMTHLLKAYSSLHHPKLS